MGRADDPHAELRKNALTAFLEARAREGFRIESRTATQAIMVPSARIRSALSRVVPGLRPARQVVAVDQHGVVTTAPAEPLRR